MAINFQPHATIRTQGKTAYYKGKALDDNPYQWCSNNNQGRHKQAAWETGYLEAEIDFLNRCKRKRV